MHPNIRLSPPLVVASLVAACGISGPQTAERTVYGVDREGTLNAAHQVLSDRSFDVETLDHQGGKLTTSWRDQGMRSRRYEITASPVSGNGAEKAALAISVRALARDRAIDGWSEGYEIAQPARRLAQDIARAAERAVTSVRIVSEAGAEEEAPAQGSPTEPECTESRDCPPGRHCGSGRCVWECSADNECSRDEQCDRRGRCVPRPPTPAPPMVEGDEEDAS